MNNISSMENELDKILKKSYPIRDRIEYLVFRIRSGKATLFGLKSQLNYVRNENSKKRTQNSIVHVEKELEKNLQEYNKLRSDFNNLEREYTELNRKIKNKKRVESGGVKKISTKKKTSTKKRLTKK